MTSLVQSVIEAEAGMQEALVDLERMKRALDTEMVRSTCHRNERDTVKAEMAVHLEEHRLLRASFHALEAKWILLLMMGILLHPMKLSKLFLFLLICRPFLIGTGIR